MSNRIAGKKCFITGGAGFIGSYLSEILLDRGCAVTAYDNLAVGTKQWLAKCLTNSRFQFIHGDLTDYENLEKTIKGHDVVWHFGANTNMVVGAKDPNVDFTNGLVATFNVLKAMKRAKVSELIFPSSGAVYGDILRPPASEDYGPLLPVSTYGASKLWAEGWISSYWHLAGIRSWIFVLATCLGSE